MKHRVRIFWRRQIMKARRKAALWSFGPMPCDTDVLRPLQRSDLEHLFDSPQLHEQWTADGAELEGLCAIEDGATGGINPGDRRAVYYLIRSLAPASVLEVGTYIGISTLYIAAAMRGSAASSPAVTTVDVEDVNDPTTGFWARLGLPTSPCDRLAAIGCEDRVRFVEASSLEFLERRERKYDFIFLDGDHTAGTVVREIPRALRVLERDGVILLHDYFPHERPLWVDGVVNRGPYQAVERLRSKEPSLAVLPLGELPWSTKLGSRVTSLAILTRREPGQAGSRP